MVRILPTLLAICALMACSLEKTPGPPRDESSRGAVRTPPDGAGTGADPVATPPPEPVVDSGPPATTGCAGPGDCPQERPFCTDEKTCVECMLDAACGEKAPRCEPTSHACVQCLDNTDCAKDAPFCDLDTHACVQCQTHTDCNDAAHPRCERKKCVSCATNDDCDHVRDRPICDVEKTSETSGACVECQAHADCKDPSKPQCTDHQCAPCTRNNDACTGRRGTTVCNLGTGEGAGTCVQCTPLNETACGDFVCDARALTCARERKNSTSICQLCVADSQCMADHRCVQLQFDSKVHGNFCLKRMSTGCTQPFTLRVDGSSLSGAASESYCGINERNTTCEAVADTISSKDCAEDRDCGAKQGDGLCRRVGGQTDKCSYPCGISAHCPGGLTCSMDESYCL